MNVLSAIKLFYFFYSVYTLFVVSVSNYKLSHAICGLVAIWVVFLAYNLGFKSVKQNNISDNNVLTPPKSVYNNVIEWRPRTYFFHVVLSWFCSIASARFYTGLSLIQTIRHLMAGTSLYAIYQSYFHNMSIATFSLAKIPFVLMLTYLTVILFVSFLGIFMAERKPTIPHYIYLVFIALAYYFFGMSRGTNFEMYIIFVLLAYCFLCRYSKGLSRAEMRKKIYSAVIWVAILGFVAIGIFRVVLTIRGSVFRNDICTEIQFDSNSIISKVFPDITNIGLSVFSYLGYGIYTIGVTIVEIIFPSVLNIFLVQFPGLYELLRDQTLSEALYKTIDVGVHWVPDWINFTGALGFPLFLGFMYVLGRVTSKCYVIGIPTLLLNLVCSLNFLFMLSIPVGNFIFTSTPNVGLLVFVLLWYIRHRHFRITIKSSASLKGKTKI